MLALLTMIWGLTFPATKAALSTTTPLQFLALRFLLGSTVFYLWLIWKNRKGGVSPASTLGKLWKPGVGIGILLMTGFILQAQGLKYTTASRSGFFTGLLTIFAPILAMLFKTSRVSLSVWMALPVAGAGVFFLAEPEYGGLNRGDVLTIACAGVFALQMIALEGFFNLDRKRSGKDAGSSVDGISLYQMAVTAIGCLLLALIEGKPLTITPAGWWGILYTGLFGSVAAVWLQTKFQPAVPAGYAGIIFTLEPLWASFFAWLILGDSWTTRGIIGAGLILAGMAISSLGVRGEKERLADEK